MSTTFLVRPYARDTRWSGCELTRMPYEVPTDGEAKRLAGELTAADGKTWVAVRCRGRLSQIVHYGREANAAPTGEERAR